MEMCGQVSCTLTLAAQNAKSADLLGRVFSSAPFPVLLAAPALLTGGITFGLKKRVVERVNTGLTVAVIASFAGTHHRILAWHTGLVFFSWCSLGPVCLHVDPPTPKSGDFLPFDLVFFFLLCGGGSCRCLGLIFSALRRGLDLSLLGRADWGALVPGLTSGAHGGWCIPVFLQVLCVLEVCMR